MPPQSASAMGPHCVTNRYEDGRLRTPMRTLPAAVLIAVAQASCACAGTPVAGTHVSGPQASGATVTRDGDRFIVALALDRDAPAWAFVHSPEMQDQGQSWRLRDWRVTTPGVTIARDGGRDVVRTIDGRPVPRTLGLELRPAPARVSASYNPVIDFGEGSLALYSRQFDLVPLGPDQAEAPLRVTWRDRAGPVMAQGRRQAEATTGEEAAYVLFGRAGLTERPDLATVLHADLPAWVAAMIAEEAPAFVAHYAERLGGGPALRPTVMVGWNGPTPRMTSMGGSVLSGLIAVSFEGEDLVAPSEDARFMIRAFLAHESAHFWLGHTVRYATEADLWITEGGAELMAARAAEALHPDFPAEALIQTLVDDCAALAVEGPVAEASAAGRPRAAYACGAAFALAAEGARAARDGGDWLDVAAELIAASRADEVVSREDWLDHFQGLADARSRAIVETLLDRGGPEAPALLGELFQRTGVALAVGAVGTSG